MDRKRVVKIVKIVLIVLVVLAAIYVLFDYMVGRGYIQNYLQVYFEGINYEPYGDPCFHEPGTPDPCSGS